MHNKIKELLLGNKPCSIGKIGVIELLHFYSTYFDFNRDFVANSLAINAGINCNCIQEYEIWIKDFAKSIQNLDTILACRRLMQSLIVSLMDYFFLAQSDLNEGGCIID